MEEEALIVEDDAGLAQQLEECVGELGFKAVSARDGSSGLKLVLEGGQGRFGFLLLDLMLPGVSGLELLKKLRIQDQRLPVIVLTSLSGEDDLIAALRLGADDYVVKPVNRLELKARINAVLRRAQVVIDHAADGPICVGELSVDIAKRKIRRGQQEVDLTRREFDILSELISRPGEPFTRAELNAAVFGCEVSGYDESISVHINRIRSKIEPDPANPRYILTVRGVGYAFCELAPEKE